MNTSAIIPVKTFSNAKSRLNLANSTKEQLCKIMLEEVLETISNSNLIDKIMIVSKDENALSLGKKFNAIQIFDEKESGVNNAVSLADDYLKNTDSETSVVFPQDIPLIRPEDIEHLMKYQINPRSVLIVPSRRFDGTNALLRRPLDIMKTHYDEDSYKIHLEKGKTLTSSTSLVLVRRIMLDVDNSEDLDFILAQNDKPSLTEQISCLKNQTS